MKKQSFFSFFLALFLFGAALPTAMASELTEITAEAALLVDIQSEQENDVVLYDKSGNARRYPASTTKIMTALLVVEAIDRGELAADELLTCSSSALADITWDATTLNLQPGEKLSVEELLYGMLCASANETANILAEAVSGSVPNFVALMNQRAAELGMENTNFVNPHGLHDNAHYSTAYDLYLLTRAAMELPLFQKIVGTADHTIPATNMAGERRFFNTNALLSSWLYAGYAYGPATGVKTGYTGQAGYCLVSSAWYEGRMLICVVLGADVVKDGRGNITDRRQFTESRNLFRWGFTNFKIQALVGPGTLVREVFVDWGKTVSYVLAGPADTISALLPTSFQPEDVVLDIVLYNETVRAPVKQGQVLGLATVSYNGVDYGSCDLVAISDVELSIPKFIGGTISDFFGNIFVRLGLVALAIFVVYRYIRTAQRKPRRGNQTPPSNTTPYPGSGASAPRKEKPRR